MRWWSRRQAVVAGCPQCGHRWDDHAGGSALTVAAADPDERELCQECGYEVVHGQRHPAPGECRLRAHHSRVQVLLGRVFDALLADARADVDWEPATDGWRTARVEVELPDGRDVVLFEDQDAVQVCVDARTQPDLTDAEERQLVTDPLTVLDAVLTRAGHPAPERRVTAQRLAERHRTARFPPRLRQEEVAGVLVGELDADVAGCVETWLSSAERLDDHRRGVLRRCRREAEAVLPHLADPAERRYVARVRELAVVVLGAAA